MKTDIEFLKTSLKFFCLFVGDFRFVATFVRLLCIQRL